MNDNNTNDVEVIEHTRALTVAQQPSHAMPALQIKEAVNRFKQMEAFVTEVMTPNIDYGVIPGTEKPTLLKPGAEKLLTFFGLSCELTVVDKTEDWDAGFFYYRYRCSIYRDGVCIAVAEGSCNSKEKKYRWRTVFANQATEEDKRTGRPERRTSKQGKPYEVYVIENREPYDLVNTIQKMAQKRSMIAGTLIAVNASMFFTQDMEDMAQRVHDDTPADDVLASIQGNGKNTAAGNAAPPAGNGNTRESRENASTGGAVHPDAHDAARARSNTSVISPAQAKRFYAIARANGWTDGEAADLLYDHGFKTANDVTRDRYEAICAVLEDQDKLKAIRAQSDGMPF